MKSGDKIEVDKVIEKYENRLIVKGSVYKPGVYSLIKKMTVKDLIEKAEGLQPDTFMDRGFITRTNEDFSTTNISFNVLNQINGLDKPIFLEKDDILNIISINDLKDENYIEISGEINRPGVYPFSKNLNLEDIILLAGGIRKNATLKSIEISRLNSSENPLSPSEVFYVDIDNLNSDSNFELKPFDNIIIRKDPNVEYLKFARIEGEVNYPGKYAISSKKERISDLIKRAGGPNEYAYYEGATIIRKTEFAEESSQIQNEINDLTRLREKLSLDESVLTESEKLLISRIDNDLEKLRLESNSNQDFQVLLKKKELMK